MTEIKNLIGSQELPNDLEAEKAIIQTLISGIPSYVIYIIENVKLDYFYSIIHTNIYELICEMYRKSIEINVLTVATYMNEMGKLDNKYTEILYDIKNAAYKLQTVEMYIEILQDLYLKRKMIKFQSKIFIDAYENNENGIILLEDLQKNIETLIQTISSPSATIATSINLAEISYEYLSQLQEGKVRIFQTYLQDLDKLTGGFLGGDLIIIGGRTSSGKTALALSIIHNNLKNGIPCGLFSLEMTNFQNVIRFCAMETGISVKNLRCGNINPSEFSKFIEFIDKFRTYPIYIDSSSSITTFELKIRAKQMKKQYNIQALFIDYLQLLTAKTKKNDTRERELSLISQTCKQIAKDLDIPVFALCQLNRSNELSKDKRPTISAIRESGAIENDADTVILIYRPETYGILKFDNGSSSEGKAEIIIPKGRNTGTGSIILDYIAHKTLFQDKMFDYPQSYRIKDGKEIPF
jgi:replicative DNA helicase